MLGNKIACSQLLLPSHSFSLTPEQLIEKHNTSGLKRGLDQGLYSKYFSACRWGTATHLSNWHLQPSKQHGIDWALRSVSVEREQVLSYILALITSYSLSGIRKSKWLVFSLSKPNLYSPHLDEQDYRVILCLTDLCFVLRPIVSCWVMAAVVALVLKISHEVPHFCQWPLSIALVPVSPEQIFNSCQETS